MSLEVGGHSDSLPAEVTVGVLSLSMFDHVQLQLVFEVEDLVTNLAVQFGSYLVLGSDVDVAPSPLRIDLLTNCALELSVYLPEQKLNSFVSSDEFNKYNKISP